MMNYRLLGKTGFQISEISLGTWQVGGRWGEAFDEREALRILQTALDRGVNFIDTADVYGGGMSEKMVGRAVKSRQDRIYVATKCGRRLDPHESAGYTRENITRFVEDSLRNMEIERLDLIQLHCPPTDVFYNDDVFQTLDDLKQAGKILHYGVSVEKVEEAIQAITYPGVASVQIIFNMFRYKPAEKFFVAAAMHRVGIIVRVPLASGLLTGKFTKDTVFGAKDHRSFNRYGDHFDKGETFSGVDYETGLAAVAELKRICPGPPELAQFALRWILMFPEVSCVIPGASRVEQVESNVAAGELPALTEEQMAGVRAVYDKHIRAGVEGLW